MAFCPLYIRLWRGNGSHAAGECSGFVIYGNPAWPSFSEWMVVPLLADLL